MTLEIEQTGPFTVTGIDEQASELIRANGGYVNQQPEFCHVGLPQGTTKRRLEADEVDAGRIHRHGRATLYRLPDGNIVRLYQYTLSYHVEDQPE